MYALITGATSGLGKSLAIKLSNMDYKIIAVGRNEEKLKSLSKCLKDVITIKADLTKEEEIYKVYNETKKYKIDLLINAAGNGYLGKFNEIDIKKDIETINLNIISLHLLTKLYLSDMIDRNEGRILNVASSAAFQPGPLMSTYYATKSYVYNLTMGIYEELRQSKSNVKIHVLCPGAFKTEFLDKAGIKNAKYVKSVEFIVDYTIKNMFKNKTVLVPGFLMRLVLFFERFLSKKTLLKINYNIQKNK